MIEFENAFEKAPEEFHNTITDTLCAITPSRAFPRRRMAVLVAALVLLLTGVAAAIVTNTRLSDFLNMEPEQMKLPITSEFTLDGGMDKVDVTVREAVYDGVHLRMTVVFSLKEAANSALIYVSDKWDAAFESAPLYGFESSSLQNAENIYFLVFAGVGYYDENRMPNAERNAFPIKDYRYESPTQMVMLIDMDLRNENGKAANPLQVYLDPRLYRYDEERYHDYRQLGAFTVTPEYEVSFDDVFDSQIIFDRKDKGIIKISVDALEQEALTYKINGLGENMMGFSIISSTLTETPIAYYLDVTVRADDDCEEPTFATFCIEANDEEGVRIPFFSYITIGRTEPDGTHTTEYQIVYLKQDNRSIATIKLPLNADGTNYDVYPITLVSMEE